MSTQPQTKYPGADTSKERLDIIVRKSLDIRGMPTEEFGMLFDLLAMIEERDEWIRDARWRRLSDEEPSLSAYINVLLEADGNTYIVSKIFGVDEIVGKWEWWQYIQPLPQTYEIKLKRKEP